MQKTLGVGERLGPYEILAPLGAGGMGEVWKARDTRLHRTVAIKRLLADHSARFEQEARAIAAFNHPHICQIYDVGPDYLVMEYVDGTPIKGPLPLQQVVALALQIAGALEAAHAKGIIHRDLKPANILVDPSGAKLLDFGLAKNTGDSDATQSLAISGTPLYMSPEQAEGKSLDARSDIFSFGAVLYELLACRKPFDSLAAVLRDNPAPLDSPLATVVKRCLAKNPSERFQSASELRAALASTPAKPEGQTPSIAVLPFVNMSADPDQEYFSDGLAEDIINALVKVPGLKVTARTSAFAFKGQNTDIRKIAETLGVAHVLEGSVRRAGNRIRVTAQLITAADGNHLWSERYDREMADVFAVQDEISGAIVAALELKLAGSASAKPRHTPSLPAYEALLKARYFHWKVTAESMAQAKGFYEQAVALDPQFALAHALYADYLFGRTTVFMSSLREVAPLSRALLKRALELEPSLPEAHADLCVIAATHDYNWGEAARQFPAATVDSASPAGRMGIGWAYLLSSGRREEAVQQLQISVEADPLHLTDLSMLAMCLTAAGRYSEAEQHLRQAMRLDPDFFWVHDMYAQLYFARGMYLEALPFAQKASALAPWYTPAVGLYAALLIRTGQPDQGKELADKLNAAPYGGEVGWTVFHLCCDDLDRAAESAEQAIAERYSMIGAVLQSALGEPLRASRHWPKLAGLMNLPA